MRAGFRLSRMIRSERLRELAAWYREFAEKTGNPQIWAARLQHAEMLEAEARSLSPDPTAEIDEHMPDFEQSLQRRG
jgi:hypothetical protein